MATVVASRRRGASSWLLPVGAAIAGGLALPLLLSIPGLPWWLRLGLFALVALAIPSSQNLSRRLLVVGSWLFGFSLLLWANRVPGLTHGQVLAGIVGAVAAGWCTRLLTGASRRRVLPRLHWVDVLPFVVAAGVLAYLPLMRFTGSLEVISQLARVWDHTSHLYIYERLREMGVAGPLQPLAPDGTKYGFTGYPSTYHMVLAEFADIGFGPYTANAVRETTIFFRVAGIGYAVVVGLLVAALTSIPAARRNRFSTTVMAGFIASLMTVGPGIYAIHDGHLNFPAGVALAVLAGSAAIQAERVFEPLLLSIIGASVVGALGAYAPMGLMAVALALPVLLPIGRRRWRVKVRDLCWAGGLIAVCVVLGLLLIRWSTSEITGQILVSQPGALSWVDQRTVTAALVATLAALLGAGALALGPTRPGRAVAARFMVAGLAPLAGFAAYLVWARASLAGGDHVTYYPLKFLNGVADIAFWYAALGVALFVRMPWAHRTGARWRRAGRGVLAVAGAASMLLVFGWPVNNRLLPTGYSPGARYLDAIRDAKRNPAVTNAVLEVCAGPLFKTLMIRDIDEDAVSGGIATAGAICGKYSNGIAATRAELFEATQRNELADEIVRQLRKDPELRFVVSGKADQLLRRKLPRELAYRVSVF